MTVRQFIEDASTKMSNRRKSFNQRSQRVQYVQQERRPTYVEYQEQPKVQYQSRVSAPQNDPNGDLE